MVFATIEMIYVSIRGKKRFNSIIINKSEDLSLSNQAMHDIPNHVMNLSVHIKQWQSRNELDN